nr:hypothetical protein [Tanacetum cinerariifolium]
MCPSSNNFGAVLVKTVNDVPRLQALVNKKKVIITEATIRNSLRLANAEGIDCLPNEEIFTELARMGYEKPLTKLTFYKAFFSSRKFKFSKYIFDNLVRNVDSSTKFYMIGKGCSGVETPLFEGIIVAQQVDEGAVKVNVEDVSTTGVVAEGAASVADDEVPTAGRIITDMDADKDVTLKDVVAIAKDVQDAEIEESSDVQGRQAESQAQIYQINLKHADKVLSMHDVDIEPAELQEVVEVVTTAKLIAEVVTTASATTTVAALQLTTAAASTHTITPSAARRRKGVVIRDPEETATPSTIIHTESKSKDKGKEIMVEKPKPLKKQA